MASRPSRGNNSDPASERLQNLEMTDLEQSDNADAATAPQTSPSTSSPLDKQQAAPSQQSPHHTEPSAAPSDPSDKAALPSSSSQPATTTEPLPTLDTTPSPTLGITLLLTNGARHPWSIDRKYLHKRSVTAEGDDPYNITVYTLKELIWRDWRSEWEARPANPSYIRLISFGRLLEDDALLKDCRFNAEAQNVVHMTVRLQEFVDEEEPGKGKGGKGRSGRGGSRSRGGGAGGGGGGEDGDDEGAERQAGCCRCVVM